MQHPKTGQKDTNGLKKMWNSQNCLLNKQEQLLRNSIIIKTKGAFMKRTLCILTACLLNTGVSYAQKAKPVAAKSTAGANKQTNPVTVAGTYTSQFDEENIVLTTSNDNPTKVTYTISEMEFLMIYDESLTKKAKGKLVFRHTTMDVYYLLEIAPGVMVHFFSTNGLSFDGKAMVQYILAKDKASLSKYTADAVKKSLNL